MKSALLNTLSAGCLTLLLGMTATAQAQTWKDIKPSGRPLKLAALGSFYVGGESVKRTFDEVGSFGTEGHISVNQMYVEYMVPKKKKGLPIAMIHGMALTGKCWETTPDGRIGWEEFFLRKGRPVYVVDQVGRGRSGFNQAIYNQVRTGEAPPDALPPLRRFTDEVVWPNFRIGDKVNEPFPNQQFPVEALDRLAIQGVPDNVTGLPQPNPNYKALSDLAISLDGAVLLSHSQSGFYPVEAALVNGAGIRGMVLVEPGGCPTNLDPAQNARLLSTPILMIYGDYLDTDTRVAGFSWRTAYESCKTFGERLNAAGGKAEMWYLPDMGIKGNSHMIMHDKNSLLIADMILGWLDRNVGK